MSRPRSLAWLLALLPLLALAGARDDYATQWPLRVDGDDAGAYRVVLGAGVYRAAQSPALDDVAVLDAEGNEVPSALFAPAPPAAQAQARALPFFPLPAAAGAARVGDLSTIATRSADGRVLRIETRAGTPATAAPRAWLVDASALAASASALELQWAPDGAAFEQACRVEASDDLRSWWPVADRAPLVDLRHAGARLLQRRIALAGERARYYRIILLQPAPAPAVQAVRAVLEAPSAAADWRWRVLPAQRQRPGRESSYEFTLPGRFPVGQADVALPGNHAIEWRLDSRDDEDAPWVPRAGPWMAYALDSGGEASHSPPRLLPGVVRDRYWRLRTRAAVPASPLLRLGYRPEALVFLAQGTPPYALVAGSGHPPRQAAPLPQLLDTLRTQRGAAWQPAAASLGIPRPLAGEAARRVPRDWHALVLWGVLVLAALVVAGFALSLLRAPRDAGART
ncbi:MAG: DUF3999 family protein [Lysobacteraceae bacterium]